MDGRKHALGCWIAETEGAKFWHSVLTDLRNRGLRDILIACCDGLSGLPEAITSVFPDTVVQTCVVHVIRNAMRFVSYQDRKKIAASMRTIYTAPTLEAAEIALKDLDTDWGRQYPGVETSGAAPGTNSSRSSTTRPNSAEWCTPRMPSNPSTSSSERLPRPADISHPTRPR